MEISSAIVGATRVGIQILSTQNRPCLELYYNYKNVGHPEQTFMKGTKDENKTRLHDQFLEFFIVNIGAIRAEKINLFLETKIEKKAGFGGAFENPIAQMAPGQVIFLFKLDIYEILMKDGNEFSGPTKEKIKIKCEYSPPNSLNWIIKKILKPSRWKRQLFETNFEFNPQILNGEFPPIEYLG